ncbi:OmpA family protein [Acinetobacter sp.]|jgi:outer membrane protein OmpA-like peptidoglycan-associated protein|uniref:OmpA family protein n=1 Tax=Acinetobacter sp. TaxID=472 RepID=UPI00282352B1|nr:OmpA family protein [Acinetobacter sp.]MDR2248498.1 outer membrane protein assembly factor BamE [Acinetobacter sp.]
MKKFTIAILAFGLLGGCATGTTISEDGATHDLKWHKASNTFFNKHQGTFPNLQSLSQIREGMTKDQLYELLGRPQYEDGWRPREWNYLFHFTTPGQGENGVTTCQYKVLFDKKMFARSFYWNPIDPKDGVCPPAVAPPVKEKIAEKPPTKRYTLGADALFRFDKSNIQDLSPKGKADLDNLITDLRQFKVVNSIRITGYTDRLGTPSYNQKLSQDRAASIKQYFANRGINPNIIVSEGRGEAQTVEGCGSRLSKAELINCLAPDRRVVIDVDGYIEQ